MPEITQTKEQKEALERVVHNLDKLKTIVSIISAESKDGLSIQYLKKTRGAASLQVSLDGEIWAQKDLLSLLAKMAGSLERETRFIAQSFYISFTKKDEVILSAASEFAMKREPHDDEAAGRDKDAEITEARGLSSTLPY